MPTQLPRVPSLIPSSFATLAIGRDVSITIFTASSLNSGEKLFLGRGNYFTFPDGPSYWMDCPEGLGHLRRVFGGSVVCRCRSRWRGERHVRRRGRVGPCAGAACGVSNCVTGFDTVLQAVRSYSLRRPP